jgi:serine/threonine-protein kinase
MIGESIGGYRIVAKLGEGGMGAVYLAEHRRIARRAAIKVLLPELSSNQEVVERFFTEARATSLIEHPGIVEIVDCDVLPTGSAYIVMELLQGESLGSYLRRGQRLPLERTLSLTRHVADALEAAHQRGIVHRDLKPDNVFLLASGAIKIVDFGIAKLMSGTTTGRDHTRPGTLLGTPVYMSPEQCRGAVEVDHRTDIYSLGCLLFEMLCGRPPFTYAGFGELIQAHLSEAPPALRSLDATLPPALEALVARLLAKSAGDRPQTMRALAAELDALLAAAPAAGPPTEVLAAPPQAARAGGTVAYDAVKGAFPRIESTLRSATAEKAPTPPVTAGATVAKRGRTAWIVALAAVALAAGGVGLWRVQMAPQAAIQTVEPALPPPAPTPAPPDPPAPPPTPVALDVPAPAPVPAPALRPTPVAPRKVKIVIASQPAAADVCLASNRVSLGKTRLEWSTEKSPHAVKLLVRKVGYRGQELAVTLNADARRQVTLEKLGPDDMDDTVNCEPK